MNFRIALLAIPIVLFSFGCSKRRSVVLRTSTPASTRAPAPSKAHRDSSDTTRPGSTEPVLETESGIASWYGYPFHGRAAANGEIYDMEKLTAAHRTLPFGTWVRVTNLANNKTVDVRVIDRGPFIAGRIIDLSHAAAQQIELIGPGVARVRIDIVAAPEARIAVSLYSVQAGIFQDRNRAEQLRDVLEKKFGAARLVYKDGKPAAWRLLIGVEDSLDGANLLARRLQSEVGSGFVVRLDEIPAGPRTQ